MTAFILALLALTALVLLSLHLSQRRLKRRDLMRGPVPHRGELPLKKWERDCIEEMERGLKDRLTARDPARGWRR